MQNCLFWGSLKHAGFWVFLTSHCHLCFHNTVSASQPKRFKVTLSRIFLSLWLILLVYHLSLLLLHVFITKAAPGVLLHDKTQLLSDSFWILLFIVFPKIDSVIIKNMAYCGCNSRLCPCRAKTLFWFWMRFRGSDGWRCNVYCKILITIRRQFWTGRKRILSASELRLPLAPICVSGGRCLIRRWKKSA